MALSTAIDEYGSVGPHTVLLWRVDVFCPPSSDHPKGDGWFTYCAVPYYASEQMIDAFKAMTEECPVHGRERFEFKVQRVSFYDPGDQDAPEEA